MNCIYALLFWQIASASRDQITEHLKEIRDTLSPGEFVEIKDFPSRDSAETIRGLINQVPDIAAHLEYRMGNPVIQIVRYQ